MEVHTPFCAKVDNGIEDGIPDRVTAKELRYALEEYAKADKEWRDDGRQNLSAKEAGDHLYRLAKALLNNKGFYTYREAVVDSMGDEHAPSPKPEDFE